MPKLFTDTTNTINPQAPSPNPTLPPILHPFLDLPLSRTELFTRLLLFPTWLGFGFWAVADQRFLAAN